MPEPVADPADIVPRKAGTQTVRIFSEPHRRLADEQKLALDCGNRLRVFPKRSQIHATHEMDDHVNAVEDIPPGKRGVPKRQLQPRVRLGRRLAP
jgi:hypothetical protein